MSMLLRVCVVLIGLAGEVLAGGVVGRVELPRSPDRPGVVQRGFLDRVENPLVPVRGLEVGPLLAVVLEGDAKPQAPGQVAWELAGEAFSRPLLVVPLGAEILITNSSTVPRTLIALEDPKLVPQGALAPGSQKSFRPAEARAYTIADPDVPHLRATLLVVNTPYIAGVDTSGGKPDAAAFQLADVAEGTYKVRVFYRDGWLDRPDDTVSVPAKRSAELTIKLPAGYPRKK